MQDKDLSDIFFTLIRLGIWNDKLIGYSIPETVDWYGIEALAAQHGLSAVVVDGIERLPDEKRPPKLVLLQWIGETLQGYEYRYDQYRKAIAELAYFNNQYGFKMMVLKGYACSLDWPKPEHRPCGDIDIWVFGQQKEADAKLTKEKGIVIDNSHHHHSVFNWGEFMVENHYDFVNVHAHKSSFELEKIFKELGKDDSHFVEIMDASTGTATKVYLPASNLHALFLLRHMLLHFSAAEISLRQVLDWAFFVEKHTEEIDWEWFEGVLEKYHMMDFCNCINAICVENLGFPIEIFPHIQFDPFLKERVLDDILNPVYTAAEPRGLIKRIVYKYHRWNGNAWKQRLCYDESRWAMFLNGIWAKMLKPSSI